MTLFPHSDWEEKENYWLHQHPQLSQEWFNERQFRLTTTSFGPIAHPNVFRGKEEIVARLLGYEEKVDPYVQKAADHGIKYEPYAREWYENRYQAQVEEKGLIVPKFNPYLGASVDGFVGEGLLEIKCLQKFPPCLDNYLEGGKEPSPFYQHIPTFHYDQMQGAMAITHRPWCHYLVFLIEEGKTKPKRVFVDHVPFDQSYWEEEIYPSLIEFISQYKHLLST